MDARGELRWQTSLYGLELPPLVAAVLEDLDHLRLVRRTADTEYEIAHDYLAQIIVGEMPQQEREDRELVEAFRRKARNYGTTAGDPLTGEQLSSLFRLRGRLAGSLVGLERRAVMFSRASFEPDDGSEYWVEDGGFVPGWWSLASLAIGKILELFRVALGDRSAKVRSVAVEVIGRLGNDDDLPLLQAALADPEPGVAAKALEAIGILGDKGGCHWSSTP